MSAGALTAIGPIGGVLSGTAIGGGMVMVPLPGFRAGLDRRRGSAVSPVAIIVVSTAIHLLRADMIRIACLFIAIGVITSRRPLLPPARLRWLVIVPVLGAVDLLLVDPGNNWLVPQPRATLGNVNSGIPSAVSGVFSAVPLPAVAVHRAVRAAVDRTHLMRGA